jgi:chromate reductase
LPCPFNIAVLIGSLRANSFSSRVAAAFEEAAPDSLQFRHVSIGDLPLYNQDLDGDKAPTAYVPFREAIADADGILIVSPEYNRSVPGGLKNAIDIGSRPTGKGVLNGKPAAVISQSPGPMGGFGANHIIRQSLVPLDMPIVQQPEIYLGQIAAALDDDGRLIDDHVRNLLGKLAAAFEALITRTKQHA